MEIVSLHFFTIQQTFINRIMLDLKKFFYIRQNCIVWKHKKEPQ